MLITSYLIIRSDINLDLILSNNKPSDIIMLSDIQYKLTIPQVAL